MEENVRGRKKCIGSILEKEWNIPLDCDNMGAYRVTDYIFMLPRDIQKGIKGAVNRALRDKFGLRGTELKVATDEAMTGRLSSLNNVINVRYWLERANTRSSR